ncbi:starch-binding domain-containing protein 1 [Erinaceus europaeus]|uniref:Starch-binding domain-containing protein 1 n=1 Tax=Erinaceus europaeus TaxID=9365 RepID=A0A1S2ZII3_ERIEU|nr:starch-binding domain-containing protein 1 [Erinaceus europaeus]
MGAIWSALLVGGGLAGALFVWLLRGKGQEGDAEPEKDSLRGEAEPLSGDQGGGGLSSGPSRPEPIRKAEHLQGSNGCLVSETKESGNWQEAVWRQQNPTGENGNCDQSREYTPSRWLPDIGSTAASEASNSRDYPNVSGNESHESSIEWGLQKGHKTPVKAATCFAKKLPSSNMLLDRGEEECPAQWADSDDWEIVSRHSSWGDIGLGDSPEAFMLNPHQGMNSGRSTLEEARGHEVDVEANRAIAMSSAQQVNVTFQVHYITSPGVQFIAITGDHESLGRWNTYIPLQYGKDGLWSHSVSLPAGAVVQWKFVVVENGGITRWEECSNRFLDTGHEDKEVHKWWGIH